MMKIGVLTFQDSCNYGAVLQAYALQHTINTGETVGAIKRAECEIIDYRSDKLSSYNKLNKMKSDNSLKGIIKKKIALDFYELRYREFDKFLKDKCNLSGKIYTKENILELNDSYDGFITGSDQVFNLRLTGHDMNYYLSFADKGKYTMSYAASAGGFDINSISEDEKTVLDKIKYISCREEGLSDDLRKMLNRQIDTISDPVFLLNKSEWEKVEQPFKIKGEYILLYLISPVKSYFKYARDLSKKTGLPVYYINYSYKKISGTYMNNLFDVTPGQFLYLIHNAKHIVTNSFHCTAFSVIYEKDFYTIMDETRKNSNSRMKNLLEKTGVSGCELISNDAIIEPHKVKYERTREALTSEREKGISFIQKIYESMTE